MFPYPWPMGIELIPPFPSWLDYWMVSWWEGETMFGSAAAKSLCSVARPRPTLITCDRLPSTRVAHGWTGGVHLPFQQRGTRTEKFSLTLKGMCPHARQRPRAWWHVPLGGRISATRGTPPCSTPTMSGSLLCIRETKGRAPAVCSPAPHATVLFGTALHRSVYQRCCTNETKAQSNITRSDLTCAS